MAIEKNQKLTLNDILITEITGAVQKTFSSMVSVNPLAGKNQFSESCDFRCDIFGRVNLTQAAPEGAMMLCFSRPTIFAILKKIYGKDFTEINKSVSQGVGELTNIIYAVMKTNLNKLGHSLKMEIPKVGIDGVELGKNEGQGPSLIMPFQSECGSFDVIVLLRPANQEASVLSVS